MIRKFFIFLAPLVMLVGLLLSPWLLILINSVECENQFGSCTADISEKLKQVEGNKLLNTKVKLKKILTSDFRIKEFRLHFNFPDKYKVSIIERKPKFVVTNESKLWFAHVDSEGYVISIVETSNLPTVVTDIPTLTTGNKLDKRLLFALELIYFVSNRYHVYSGKLIDNSLSVEIKPFREVLLPVEGDKELILGQLIFLTGNAEREIVNKLDRGGTISLDLRFKNPVLKY